MSYSKEIGIHQLTFLTKEDAIPPQAVDPITQEIDWDCPCISGMTKPPCGELFKKAFKCFIYSKEDQKGVDCLGAFQDMQTCFGKYPDLYSDYLD